MTLSAGTVAVTADAVTGAPAYVGSGLALALVQAYLDAYLAQSPAPLPPIPAVGATSAPGGWIGPWGWSVSNAVTQDQVDAMVAGRQALFSAEALRATHYAAAIVSHITANAKVFVDVAPLGPRLGSVGGVPIDQPLAPVYLDIA